MEDVAWVDDSCSVVDWASLVVPAGEVVDAWVETDEPGWAGVLTSEVVPVLTVIVEVVEDDCVSWEPGAVPATKTRKITTTRTTTATAEGTAYFAFKIPLGD